MSRPAVKLRIVLLLTIFCSCIGCDQATKQFATKNLQESPPQSFLGDTVRLDYALNPGGFLSAGGAMSPESRFAVFIIFNSCVMTGLAVFLFKTWDSPILMFISLAYILAGGIGNLIDRVTNDGLVTDFLNLGIGSLRTGIFNVADVAVLLGTFGLFISIARSPDKAADDEPESLTSAIDR
jgi:signal peptidase II